MHIGRTISSVQTPIIPVIGEWTRNSPGTLSPGQGMVSYPPPSAALQAIRDFGSRAVEHLYGSPLGYEPLLKSIKAKLRSENSIDCTSGYCVMLTSFAVSTACIILAMKRTSISPTAKPGISPLAAFPVRNGILFPYTRCPKLTDSPVGALVIWLFRKRCCLHC